MKQPEEKTIHPDLLYRALNASSNGIVITDPARPDNPIVFVNRAYEIMSGYSAQEAIGRNPRFLQGPETDPETRETLRRAIQEKRPCTVTILNYRKDGSTFWNEVTVSPVFDESGKLTHFIGVKTDITERKRLEEELHTIFESAPNGMVIADEDGKMVMVNAQMEKLFGYLQEELIGQPVEILVPERYRAGHPAHRKAFMAKPGVKPMGSRPDLTGLRKDGGEIAIELGLSAFETEKGRMALATIMDISERKKMEVIKNEFISIVSHELRTPLTSIRGSLGLIAGGVAGPLPEQAKTFLDIAVNNCERMVRLVNDILDIEKIEAGAVTPRMEPVDLEALVEETIEANRSFGLEFGVTLALRATIPGVKVIGDGDLITRVLTNLVSNAVKFSPRGGVVEISITRHETFLRTSVFNAGAGIPEKFRHLIFQKFAQATIRNLAPKGGSTGLGLSIGKAIVDMLGGRIDFETTPGAGTTFYFDLPASH